MYYPVTLQQGINFRDQGGYRAADGRRIKRGLLFRSGSLDLLTDQDCQTLAEMGVGSILDYRDLAEATAKPDRLWHNADYFHVPANPKQGKTADLSQLDVLLQHDPDEYMLSLYRLLPFQNPAYQQLVGLMTEKTPRPFVQHCAVGKDRTGVGSALVLFALGADQETVFEDYLTTEKTLAPFKEKMLAQYAAQLTDKQLNACRTLFQAKEAYLAAAIDAILQRYTSIDQWLAQEYGLTAERRAHLYTHYLADN